MRLNSEIKSQRSNLKMNSFHEKDSHGDNGHHIKGVCCDVKIVYITTANATAPQIESQ